MNRIVMIVTTLCLFGCMKKPVADSPVCKLLFKATTGAATVVSSALQCENTAQIAADMSEQVMKLGVCAEIKQQSTMSELICPQITAMVSSIITTSVPLNWKCSVTVVNEIVKSQISENCAKLIK